MRWEERLLGVFEDLEQQAEGLALDERDAAVAELAPAEYARVDLAARLHASLGLPLVLDVAGHGRLTGTLLRAGRDWLLLEEGPGGPESLVRTAAVAVAHGVSPAARGEEARSVAARLGLASALRGLADERGPLRLSLLDGRHLRGRVVRVGADFFELAEDSGGYLAEPYGGREPAPALVAFAAMAVVTRI